MAAGHGRRRLFGLKPERRDWQWQRGRDGWDMEMGDGRMDWPWIE